MILVSILNISLSLFVGLFALVTIIQLSNSNTQAITSLITAGLMIIVLFLFTGIISSVFLYTYGCSLYRKQNTAGGEECEADHES
jgi:hypothetical protein